MAFGHKADPTIVYQFDAKAPTSGLESVRAQMRAAHKYTNALVEIENRRREAVTQAVCKLSPDYYDLKGSLSAAKDAMKGCRASIKAVRQKARKRVKTPDDLKSELATLKAQIDVLGPLYASAKELAYSTPEAKAALKGIQESTNAAIREARARCGVYSGTYMQVEAAMQQACGSSPSLKPLKFRRWSGEGKLAVRIQGGLPVDRVFTGSNQVIQVDPIRHIKPNNAPRSQCATTVRFRVCSEDRKPVWAELPIVMHRPLPADARITWVYLVVRKVACHEKWSVCFVLARKSGWRKPDLASGGKVGIDVGWRRVPTGLRVAYWSGDDGQTGEVILPESYLDRWRKSDELESIRDRQFNEARDRLREWLKNNDVPEWLAEKTQHLAQWKSKARLASVTWAWKQARFTGDSIYEELEAWRKQDKHLYEWEANNRRKAAAYRLHTYRNLAATLSRRYKVAKIEDTDWRQLAKNAKAEDDKSDTYKYNMRAASPGLLLSIVKQRFAQTEECPAEYTTQTCHACGELVRFDAAARLRATCPACKANWDQDHNASKNLLQGLSDGDNAA